MRDVRVLSFWTGFFTAENTESTEAQVAPVTQRVLLGIVSVLSVSSVVILYFPVGPASDWAGMSSESSRAQSPGERDECGELWFWWDVAGRGRFRTEKCMAARFWGIFRRLAPCSQSPRRARLVPWTSAACGRSAGCILSEGLEAHETLTVSVAGSFPPVP